MPSAYSKAHQIDYFSKTSINSTHLSNRSFYRKEQAQRLQYRKAGPFLFSPQSTLIWFAANDVEYAAPQQVHGKHHPPQTNAKYKVI
jgi:hypothetical protein